MEKTYAKNLGCKKFGRGARSIFWSLKFLGIKVDINESHDLCGPKNQHEPYFLRAFDGHSITRLVFSRRQLPIHTVIIFKKTCSNESPLPEQRLMIVRQLGKTAKGLCYLCAESCRLLTRVSHRSNSCTCQDLRLFIYRFNYINQA